MTQSDGVSQDNQWPIQVGNLTTFTITRDFNEKSELYIEIIDEKRTYKSLKISKHYYVDFSTNYFVIKKNINKTDKSSFQIKMEFLKTSHNKQLQFHWFPSGSPSPMTETDLEKSHNVIYSMKVVLKEKWKIKLSVEIEKIENNKSVYYGDEKYFQHGKTAKITCGASDGLPESRVYVNGIHKKRFRSVTYDNSLNVWEGFITLKVNDHNSNISCHVADTNQFQSIQIKVNHPTTLLNLDPEYTGFIKNGSKIRCIPHDGYPTPLIKWDFISVKNHSSSKPPYQIINDVISISEDISLGTQIEFNCTAIYTNPFQNVMSLISKNFRFEVGEKSNNIEMVSTPQAPINVTEVARMYEKLNKAAIGAGVAGVVIMIIAISIVVMLCRSKPKPTHSSTHQQEGSPKYSGSLLAGSKSALHNQMKSQNGASSTFIPADTNVNSELNEFNYDDMPRGRRPIKVVDDPVVYSTIVGTMQPKLRPSLDLGPIDRV